MRWLEEAALGGAPIRSQAAWRLAQGLAVLVAIAIAIAGPLVGPDVGFDFLCLWPIGVVTWGAGAAAGLALSFGCAVAALGAGLAVHGAVPDFGARLAVHLWNFVVQLGVFGSQTLLLAALRGRMRREHRLALTDELTGIANRRAFEEAVDREIERVRRQGRPLTLVYLDVDDFKALNDRFGHVAGDEVLRTVGASLKAGTRRLDTPARVGGDEFALLLPDTPVRAAAALLGRLRERLGSALVARGHPVGLSMGAVTFEEPPSSGPEMVALADAAMYRAKRAGKGTIRLEVAGDERGRGDLEAAIPA
ncbi:MAG TPA: GGDEF domain-containing protein [Anaeromyxobacteraceae bacterium]|nr:GGDEF domain-containing protein [Anaeromyxobacteraceae bacterium]